MNFASHFLAKVSIDYVIMRDYNCSWQIVRVHNGCGNQSRYYRTQAICSEDQASDQTFGLRETLPSDIHWQKELC